MSVKDRLIDAQILYSNGRKEGALLSVLVAISATARKRYPRMIKNDGDSFQSFLSEELPRIIRIGQFNIKYRNEMVRLEQLLYSYIRCNLAHEAVLPQDIHFEPGDSLKVNVQDDRITFSDHLIDILATAVIQAPENLDEFADGQRDQNDG
jgi:hypothetical protein